MPPHSENAAPTAIGSGAVFSKAVAAKEYSSIAINSTADVRPWEHVTVGLQLAISRIERRYCISQALARTVAEHSGLGGRE